MTLNANRIAEILSRIIEQNPNRNTYHYIQSSARKCTCFAKKYIDLFHFYQNLQKNLDHLLIDELTKETVHELLEEGLNIISRSVIDYVYGNIYPESHGLSIYFDYKHMDSTYPTTLWAQETQWLSFMQKYYELKKSTKNTISSGINFSS